MTAARERLHDALRAAGSRVERGGDTAQCPAHPDSTASLTIGTRDDGNGVTIYCHAGCTADAIVAAMGLRLSDLYDEQNTNGSKPVIVATYDYVDETGVLLWQKLRYVPKRFVQRAAGGAWSLKGIRRVLYRLPELLASDGPVYLCEGEKDADAMIRAGVVATAWTEGAWKPGATPKWRSEYTELLAGRDVRIVRDRDEAGEHTAATIADMIRDSVASVRIVEAAEGKDAADHLAAGRTVAELVEVAGKQFDPLIPLAPVFDNVEFPTSDLPPAFRDMVEATAADLSVDPAMCATITLAVLSAAVGGRVLVEGKPGWREPTNLYALTIAAPSELKSPANSRLVRPLGEAEKQLVADSARARTEQATQKQIQDGIAKKAQEKAIKTGDHADREAACFEAQAAADLVVEAAPRLLCDDITSEALAGLAADQGGPMAVISAEGGLFETIAGRYSSGVPNLDIWLKGFSGEYFSSDRAGRRGEPIIIQRPTLTVGLMAQPVVLEAIGRNDQFKGRGLLSRFLYCRPASRAGHRQFDTPKVPHTVREAYHQHVIDLAVHYHRDRGAEVEVLTLDGQARGMLRDLWNRVELALRPGGDLADAGEWAGKFRGMVLRIAGLLHIAEHGVIHDPVITAATMAAAVRIGDYFLVQARAALHTMGADPIFADATYVVDRIKAKGDPEISARDLFQEVKSRFKKMDDLLPVLAVLIEHSYLVELPKAHSPKGGRPSTRYAVHPDAFVSDPRTPAQNPQNPQNLPPEQDFQGFEGFEGSEAHTAATDYACRVHPGTPASPGACWTCDQNRQRAA